MVDYAVITVLLRCFTLFYAVPKKRAKCFDSRNGLRVSELRGIIRRSQGRSSKFTLLITLLPGKDSAVQNYSGGKLQAGDDGSNSCEVNESLIRVEPFFFEWIAAHVISVLLPESSLILAEKLESAYPLH